MYSTDSNVGKMCQIMEIARFSPRNMRHNTRPYRSGIYISALKYLAHEVGIGDLSACVNMLWVVDTYSAGGRFQINISARPRHPFLLGTLRAPRWELTCWIRSKSYSASRRGDWGGAISLRPCALLAATNVHRKAAWRRKTGENRKTTPVRVRGTPSNNAR